MATSGEMRATVPATMQDLHTLEVKLTDRQLAYEKKCEDDRRVLHGDIDSLTTVVKRVEAKTDEGNNLVRPIAKMFESVFSHPKVQAAALVAVLALLGFVTYKLNSLTAATQPPNPSIIVLPSVPQHDGGTTFTVQQ